MYECTESLLLIVLLLLDQYWAVINCITWGWYYVTYSNLCRKLKRRQLCLNSVFAANFRVMQNLVTEDHGLLFLTRPSESFCWIIYASRVLFHFLVYKCSNDIQYHITLARRHNQNHWLDFPVYFSRCWLGSHAGIYRRRLHDSEQTALIYPGQLTQSSSLFTAVGRSSGQFSQGLNTSDALSLKRCHRRYSLILISMTWIFNHPCGGKFHQLTSPTQKIKRSKPKAIILLLPLGCYLSRVSDHTHVSLSVTMLWYF